MPPAQSAAYLERLRDRLVAIKQNTKQNAFSLKTKLTDSFGRKNNNPVPALQPLAIPFDRPHMSLRPVNSDDDGSMSPLRRQDSYARSDSMNPVVPPDHEDGNRDEGMEGEEETEGDSYKGYHSLNSMKMRKTKLEEWRAKCDRGRAAGLATVGRAKGQEMLEQLRNMNGGGNVEKDGEGRQEDEGSGTRQGTIRSEVQDNEEEEVSSNPYPNDFPIPSSPPEARTNDEAEVSSNPYPNDFPMNYTPETHEPKQLDDPITPSPYPSSFAIFPADRTISPISPFNAARHKLSTHTLQESVSTYSLRSYEQCDEYIDRYLLSYPEHECSKLEGEERRRRWDEMYASEETRRRKGRGTPNLLLMAQAQERLLGSASQSYEGQDDEPDLRRAFMESLGPEARRRAAEAESRSSVDTPLRTGRERTEPGALDEQGRVEGKRKSSAGRRVLHTLVCRPGTCTPGCSALPISGPINPYMTAPPQKFKFSSRLKFTLTRRKDKGKRPAKPQTDIEPIPELGPKFDYQSMGRDGRTHIPTSWRAQYIEERNNLHSYYQPPTPGSWLSSGRGGKVEGKKRSISGPPVDLSRMIQRAPDSPVPRSRPTPPQQSPRQGYTSPSPNPSLSERLSQMRLRDLRLPSTDQQEVEDLIRTLDRDRSLPLSSTLPRRSNQTQLQLPAGFTHDTMRAHTPREALERRFESQRQVNERAKEMYREGEGRSVRSHSSSLSLPRGWRVPEGRDSNSGLSIPQRDDRRNGEASSRSGEGGGSPLGKVESADRGRDKNRDFPSRADSGSPLAKIESAGDETERRKDEDAEDETERREDRNAEDVGTERREHEVVLRGVKEVEESEEEFPIRDKGKGRAWDIG